MRRISRKRDGRDHLRIISGPQEGRRIALHSLHRAVIGRSSACEVTIKDLSVSRQHAELERNASGRWRVRDMDSRNGISVDGRTGPGWLDIGPGSTLLVGDVRMTLDAEIDSLEAATDPAVSSLPGQDLEAEARSEDPPSLPDLEPPRLAVSTPAWRKGVMTTGILDDEESQAPPSYFLGAAIGLGVALALAGTVLLVARVGSDRIRESVGEEAIAHRTATAALNAQMDNGREAAEREQWARAEASLQEVLSMSPGHTEAQELLALASREKRAVAEVSAAEAAYEGGDRSEAVLLAEGVHAASRYRQRADDLLDRMEAESEPSSRRAAGVTRVRRPAQRATSRPAPRATSRPAPSPPRPSSPAPQADTGPDPIIVEAKRAFSEGRVSAARAAAEAAADAEVPGAAGLARKLDAFHRAGRSGEAARNRSQTLVALAHYSDAHALAREIIPPSGGAPAGEIAGHLADLHYQCALDSLGREDAGAARAHLERALGFRPAHGQARALMDRL